MKRKECWEKTSGRRWRQMQLFIYETVGELKSFSAQQHLLKRLPWKPAGRGVCLVKPPWRLPSGAAEPNVRELLSVMIVESF